MELYPANHVDKSIPQLTVLISQVGELYGCSDPHIRGELLLQSAFLVSTNNHSSSSCFNVIPLIGSFNLVGSSGLRIIKNGGLN